MKQRGFNMRGTVAALCCLLLLAGCDIWDSGDDSDNNSTFGTQLASGEANYVDRCVDTMQEAYPNASFNVTNKRLGLGPNVALVDVKATRSAGRSSRDVAAQCRFESGVLVEFHWTATPL